MLAGLTLGKNNGGVITTASDLNDPNFALNYPDGIVGDDSKYAFRLAGSYILPYGITASGSSSRIRAIPISRPIPSRVRSFRG